MKKQLLVAACVAALVGNSVFAAPLVAPKQDSTKTTTVKKSTKVTPSKSKKMTTTTHTKHTKVS